ncbi:succinate dehydrogenase/fumarate reductase iron-sulfur subunit [bacterium]|nr:succinate dehydrogenase/fumarate reductase iron-sulfur subunit [bacterium]
MSKYHLQVWRQAGRDKPGSLVDYTVDGIIPNMSFLEMLDVLNENLVKEGKESIAFDSDCREGICGMCGLVINGVAHGPHSGCTTCAVRMRDFPAGSTIVVEPFRAKAFPVLKDLVVDRSAFDHIIAAGGYVSVNAGAAPDANAILVGKEAADRAMDAAACIGCGGCVAACPNASAALFTSAKITQLANLPQGQPERSRRVVAMVEEMDRLGFGDCSNHGECEAVCPKEIDITHIAQMRRDYMMATLAP